MHYFAYGSNMNIAHMRRLCGWNCRVIGPAALEGFEFGLDKRGYNNIRPKHGEKVWGVLYDLNEAGLKSLDEFEGYPKVFGREEVLVVDSQNQQYKAWVYRQPPEEFGGKNPRPEYFSRILAGAEENGLPGEWIKRLESFLGQRC